jgi:(p)ppGpp synthase/HD superfamily hydrolase
MSLVARAEVVARLAHLGQPDKQGRPYADAHLAPIAAALRVYGPDAEAAGWLHDVIEDTSVTAADLLVLGFPAEVVDAVVAVSRVPGETYVDLIYRAADHPLGVLVKLADNAENLAANVALAEVDPKAAASLRRRYIRARRVLLASPHLSV